MPIVLDASVTLAFLLPDETSGQADRIVAGIADDGAIVPAIWWFEVRNALLVAWRRKRLNDAQLKYILSRLGSLPIDVQKPPEHSAILVLAQRHQLSFYDGAYLELAVRLGFKLATFDEKLSVAAKAEQVLFELSI